MANHKLAKGEKVYFPLEVDGFQYEIATVLDHLPNGNYLVLLDNTARAEAPISVKHDRLSALPPKARYKLHWCAAGLCYATDVWFYPWEVKANEEGDQRLRQIASALAQGPLDKSPYVV